MAGRIARSFIDELIARVDIVELIGSRVPLKRAGHEFKACCPFHDEKTPSFWVSPAKQFYHCFGCGAHGTAIGFLVEYDRMSFPEAIEELAMRLAMAVVYEPTAGSDSPGHAEIRGTVDTAASRPLYDLLAQVAQHYQSNLRRSEAARAYAARRGLTPEIIERFAIGYAMDSWNDVLRSFGGTETALRALADAGLIIERDGASEALRPERGEGMSRHYDRFRDRLMFPIRDGRGRVMAFGGRVLGSGEPKYLNSPETVLFHKGRELYGLYETRLARQQLKRLLIVEGYMDTVRLHQQGLPWAVATLGTATTAEQVRRAFRLVNELVFCFDGDRAGRAAAWRALQNVLPETRAGREIRFLFLPEGEDPDSLVGGEGGERFEARLAAAVPLSEYLVSHLAEEADVSHADGKARFIALARPLLERVAPGVYRELLLEHIAERLALPAERLQHWLASPTASGIPPSPTAISPRTASPTAGDPRNEARAPARTRRNGPQSAGRGSLVTQAITLLLHFPASATGVGPEQRAALASIQQPGVAVLGELLTQQAAEPAASMAQTLERWRDRHEYRRLCQLAATTPLVTETAAAARELCEAVRRLLDRELRSRRLETLILKARQERLDEAEKLELQALTTDQAAGSAASSPSALSAPPKIS